MTELDRLRGVVLAMDGDGVALEAAGGDADRPAGIPCTPPTRFQVASVSKQFTAAAVLLMAERGVLAVSDPIGRWIDGCPAAWAGITLHHLLSHTSGLGHWSDLPGLDLTAPLPVADLLQTFFDAPPHDAPGAAWRYSSPGYVLLANAVQRAAGRPFAAFLQEEVFAPAGMASTFSGSPGDRELVARGHAEGVPVPSFELDVVGMGTGAVWSTAADLARWDAALAAGTFLGPASRRAMLTAHAAVGQDGTVTDAGYGYGWFTGRLAGRRVIFHPGDNAGFKALNAWFPDDGARVVLLSNDESTDVERLLMDVLAAALPRLVEAT